jgi:hypothetical protein
MENNPAKNIGHMTFNNEIVILSFLLKNILLKKFPNISHYKLIKLHRFVQILCEIQFS